MPVERRLLKDNGGLRINEKAFANKPDARHPKAEIQKLRIIGARHNNLKNVDVEIPLGAFVCVTGVCGSGKSSLVNDILAESLLTRSHGRQGPARAHERIEGVDQLDKLIAIDQSPIGRTPRSNPATYIKLFDDIRNLYTQLPESKRRGYKPGRFSFNVQGGRCEACEGNGSNRLEMDFLADVWVTCPVCEGHRFNRETLQVMYQAKRASPKCSRWTCKKRSATSKTFRKSITSSKRCTTSASTTSNSGSPRRRSPAAKHSASSWPASWSKESTGRTLYLLDEPTTGLHFADIELLLKVLHDFVDAGNTVLVVEHNLDVVKTADWVIDMGPEGGAGGGRVVACGTPEEVARCAESHTGQALAPMVGIKNATSGSAAASAKRATLKNRKPFKEATHITIRGARQHNLRDLDLKSRATR